MSILAFNYIFKRENECVRNIDMLHAPDYSDMTLEKLVKTMNQRKKLDADLKKYIRLILMPFTSVFFVTIW